MQRYVGGIVATAVPARDIREGDSVQLKDVCGEEALGAAEANGSVIYALDPDTLEPSTVLFDGGEWLMPRPTPAREPEVTVPTTGYVDERTEVVQSELEAVAEVLAATTGSAAAKRAIATLRQNMAQARVAMGHRDSVAMATIAESLSDTKGTAIYTVAQAKEAARANGTVADA